MTVDFHIHSTASDGTLSPRELADRTRNFAAVALTDHDTCDGAGEFLAGSGSAVRRFAGLELSIEPGEDFDRFHLLGLGVDPRHPGLRALLRAILEGRRSRNARMLADFRRLGIGMDGVGACANGDVLARPHFARWLVAHGFADDVPSAFAKYLLPDSPAGTRCYEERFRPPQEEAFAAIHAAGGICVMAHPKFARRDWKTAGCDFDAFARALPALLEKGLDGIEAIYGANTSGENVAFASLALRQKCLATAGSDFHGANKPAALLGMDVSESFAAPVLERLGPRSVV